MTFPHREILDEVALLFFSYNERTLYRWDLTWESSILSHHAQVDLLAIDLIFF
jgi:hypothetical protein